MSLWSLGFSLRYCWFHISGGMFALGAAGSDDEEKYKQLGADIANTCHESYDRSGKFTSYGMWITLPVSIF